MRSFPYVSSLFGAAVRSLTERACERARERERECVCVYVCVRKRKRVRKRKGERERDYFLGGTLFSRMYFCFFVFWKTEKKIRMMNFYFLFFIFENNNSELLILFLFLFFVFSRPDRLD